MEINIHNSRNYGIDLLRILAMYMVVLLHVTDCGIIESCEKYSMNYYVGWFIETAVYCAANVFAMITGYVMTSTVFNGFKMITLWLMVFFYSATITILFYFVPSFSVLHEVSKAELIKGICFPVISRQYWYFSSYFGMFFFIPFINKMLHSLSEKEHKILCVTIIVIFSLLSMVGDAFRTGGGYTTLWLTCLYVLGAYFKLHPVKLSKTKCFALYIISVSCAWLAKMIMQALAARFMWKNMEINYFISYTSIFIVVSGVALLLLFSQIEIKGGVAQKIIGFVSSLAFSVYIIHAHPFIFNYVLNGRFSDLAYGSGALLTLKVLLIAFLIFITCCIIDVFRCFLFKLFKIHKIPGTLMELRNKRLID